MYVFAAKNMHILYNLQVVTTSKARARSATKTANVVFLETNMYRPDMDLLGQVVAHNFSRTPVSGIIQEECLLLYILRALLQTHLGVTATTVIVCLNTSRVHNIDSETALQWALRNDLIVVNKGFNWPLCIQAKIPITLDGLHDMLDKTRTLELRIAAGLNDCHVMLIFTIIYILSYLYLRLTSCYNVVYVYSIRPPSIQKESLRY